MTKLNNAQDAIKQAIEGGYKSPYFQNGWPFPFDDGEINTILLGPAFWQTLGKARGWSNTITCGVCGAGTSMREYQGWEYNALKWFETRLSNGDENKFWQTLP